MTSFNGKAELPNTMARVSRLVMLFVVFIDAVTIQCDSSLFTAAFNAGVFLGAHKFTATDERYPEKAKLEGRRLFLHFPIPRLKELHTSLAHECEQGVERCVTRLSDDFKTYFLKRNWKMPRIYPFESQLDLFQYRTTGSYFMCMFALEENPLLSNIIPYGTCVQRLNMYLSATFEMLVIDDNRRNAPAFTCARILFCPDPCYGRGTKGDAKRWQMQKNDKSNPCGQQINPECTWTSKENSNYDALIRNKFNFTCICKEGYRWSSRFRMCKKVDECLEGTKICRVDEVCQNLAGTATCVCGDETAYNNVSMRCEQVVLLPKVKTAISSQRRRTIKDSGIISQIQILLGMSSAVKTTVIFGSPLCVAHMTSFVLLLLWM